MLIPACYKYRRLPLKGTTMDRKYDGDEERFHFKTDRFVHQNGEWFYCTREGTERGPFSSRDDAEGDIAMYIRKRLNLEEFGM